MRDSLTFDQISTSSVKSQVRSRNKEHLFRGFNLFMSFSMSFTNAAVIPQLFTQIGFGLTTGGPVVMLYGWLLVGLFTILTAFSMAEICSAYPVAGSVYYWSGVLAPQKYAPIASYACGWLNFLGNLANCSSLAYGLSNIVVGFKFFGTDGSQSLSQLPKVCISIIIILSWTLKNSIRIDHQGIISDISSVYQILSTFVLIIAIITLSPMLSSQEFVFTRFNNQTGFSNVYYVGSIGLLSSLYAFSGYEGAATMAEETQNPHKTAHKGIIYTCLISAIVGLVLILGILYGAQENIEYIVSGPSDAATNFFSLICNHKYSGTLLLSITLMLNIFLSGLSSITVTSRIAYAIARDGVLPFSSFLNYINPKTKSPDRIILLIFALQSLLLTLPLLSTTAFTTIIQISTICFQLSYALPIFLRITTAKDSFQRNEFHLGRFSIVIGWISFTFLIVTSVILLFPTQYDKINGLTLQNFNYTSIVLGMIMIIAVVYWNLPAYLGGAKHSFKGPLRTDFEIEKESNITLKDDDQQLNYLQSYRTFDVEESINEKQYT